MTDIVERLRELGSSPSCEPISSDHLADFHEAAAEIQSLRAQLAAAKADADAMAEALENPPKHRFWSAGEADCPREIKAGNGELHTLRCKICGIDSPHNGICRAALAKREAGNV